MTDKQDEQEISVEILIQHLRDEDWQVRYDAANQLKALGDTRAVPALIRVLEDENLTVRFIAAMTLGIIHDERAVLPLINLLRTTHDHDVLWAAGWALSELGALSTKPLIDVLKTNDPLTRDVAADVLGTIGDDSALPHLKQVLAAQGVMDYPFTGRFGAADALDRFGGAAVPTFIDLLDHESEDIRVRVVRSLGRHEAATAVTALVKHLDDTALASLDEEVKVCDAVAEVLEKIGTPEAQQAVAAWREGASSA